MNKTIMFKVVGLALFACFMLTGCGKKVEIPSAYVGKVITKEGMQDGLKHPSQFRLPFDLMFPPKLVLVETSDRPLEIQDMQIYMHKDQLNVISDLRGTYTISAEEENVAKILEKITPEGTQNDRVMIIAANRVYDTYALQVIRESARVILKQYTIAEVMERQESISAELFKMCTEKLKDSPIRIIRMGFADIQPPPVILKAQESAKEREVMIQQAEAQKQIDLAQASARFEVAQKQQSVDLLEAETQVLVNIKMAQGVNNAFIAQRGLKILEAMVLSDNKVFFIPQEAFNNPALLIPSIQDAFEGNNLDENNADLSKIEAIVSGNRNSDGDDKNSKKENANDSTN